jgi:hypothetical protein
MVAGLAPQEYTQPAIVRQHGACGRKVCHFSRRALGVARKPADLAAPHCMKGARRMTNAHRSTAVSALFRNPCPTLA